MMGREKSRVRRSSCRSGGHAWELSGYLIREDGGPRAGSGFVAKGCDGEIVGFCVPVPISRMEKGRVRGGGEMTSKRKQSKGGPLKLEGIHRSERSQAKGK